MLNNYPAFIFNRKKPKKITDKIMFTKTSKKWVTCLFSVACATSVHAVSLDFTLPTADLNAGGGNAEILNYYDGGTDQFGGTGPNYGISFGTDALALGQYAQYPGYSNTGNEPGGGNALFFLNGTEDVMNIAAGFTKGFSFYYDCPSYLSGSIQVWSGLNNTGTLLASLTLPGTSLNSTEPFFGNWTPIGVTFSGVAESVDFAGTANEITFADVTLGSGVPQIGNSGSGNSVPDNTGLSTYVFAGLGLVAMGCALPKRGNATV
jgi:hypothetical protein